MPAEAARQALARFPFIDGAARERLARYADVLQRWQRVHNLVSAASLDELWTRHIADSAQLVRYAPEGFRRWVDLGSGAGFPGLVAAAILADRADGTFTLVEANQKKCAFLRAAIREMDVRATVAASRIEAHSATMRGQADVVSARALASFESLCRLAHPYLSDGGKLLLLKGQDFAREEAEAAPLWDCDIDLHPSETDPAGCVVAVSRLRPKAR